MTSKNQLPSAGAIIFDSDLNLLIVHQKRSGKWSIPKGHLKNEKEDKFECAKREIREETGLNINLLSDNQNLPTKVKLMGINGYH